MRASVYSKCGEEGAEACAILIGQSSYFTFSSTWFDLSHCTGNLFGVPRAVKSYWDEPRLEECIVPVRISLCDGRIAV